MILNQVKYYERFSHLKFFLKCFEIILFNPKTAGGVNLAPPSPFDFSENVFSKERVKPRFFVTFNIILRHIFTENFIELLQVAQKI